MKKLSVLVLALAGAGLFSASTLVGCEVIRKPDGTLHVRPSDGSKPRTLPPSRYERITINDKCYIKFETPAGPYCIPCDVEEGYAVSCDEIIDRPISLGLPSANAAKFKYDIKFNLFVSETLDQEGVARNNQAILSAYGYDTWQQGDVANMPMALERLDTDLNYISMYVISRSDWEWPDNGSGSQLDALFFGDPTDSIPDATIFRVRGSLEEVTDSIGAMFTDGMIWSDTHGDIEIDLDIFPINDDRYQGFLYLDGVLVWQRW